MCKKRYTITVTNIGHRGAAGVALKDTLDPNVTFISASAGGSYSSTFNTVSWSLFDLPTGLSETRTVTVEVNDPLPAGITQIRNAAIATDDGTNGLDPYPNNNTDTDIDDIAAAPNIEVTKTDGVTIATPVPVHNPVFFIILSITRI